MHLYFRLYLYKVNVWCTITIIISMISRQFRAFNVGGFSVNNISDHPFGKVRNLTDMEVVHVTEMESIYKKLLTDEIFIDGLELMETKIQSMKIELANMTNQKHDLMRMHNEIRRVILNGNSNNVEYHSVRLMYFTERHEDIAIRCRVLNDKIKSLRCRLVGMCYWPLIAAMKKIMFYHSQNCNNDICHLRSGPNFILSNILLLILCNCDNALFPAMTSVVSKWSTGNICSHPIIKMIESNIDEQMYWQRNISLQTPLELVENITKNVFENYEVSYLEWVVINMMSTYLKYCNRYSPERKIIFSLNGIGILIYGFLITEEKVLSLLTKLRVVKKRKFEN